MKVTTHDTSSNLYGPILLLLGTRTIANTQTSRPEWTMKGVAPITMGGATQPVFRCEIIEN